MGKENNFGLVKCVNNKFVFHSEIDFRNYFDAAHDEGVNCSKFANTTGLSKYLDNLAELNQQQNVVVYRCPMDEDLLNVSVEKIWQILSVFD